MTHLLIVTPDQTRFADLSTAIKRQEGTAVHWAADGRRALETLDEQTVDLVVVDEGLANMTGLAFIERLVAKYPMINSAIVSRLSPEAFHEASEGLGILMQLPIDPSQADGERLMTVLNQILGLTATVKKATSTDIK